LSGSQALARVIAPIRIGPPASIDQQIWRSADLEAGQSGLLGTQLTAGYWVVVVLVVFRVVATVPDGVMAVPFV
jgi:hypothetical protein